MKDTQVLTVTSLSAFSVDQLIIQKANFVNFQPDIFLSFLAINILRVIALGMEEICAKERELITILLSSF